jgi:G3E family GTPase
VTSAVADTRCPVLVLTGALGSGKTTLLRHWLGQDLLRSSVVIINEIGEASFDPARLGPGLVAAGVLTGRCLCCTGLPDLQDTLERLLWDRLHRRGPPFDRVVIETSGVASPRPVADLLSLDPLLRSHFGLETVVAALSTTHPDLESLSTAEQVADAQVLVLTKCDWLSLTEVAALRAQLALRAAGVPVLTSSLAAPADLAQVLSASRAHKPPITGTAPSAAAADRWRDRPLASRHGESGPAVHTWFVPLTQALALSDLRQQAAEWLAKAPVRGLLRLKGYWRCQSPLGGDQPWEVQWTQGDPHAQIGPVDLPTSDPQGQPWGVTFIATRSSNP